MREKCIFKPLRSVNYENFYVWPNINQVNTDRSNLPKSIMELIDSIGYRRNLTYEDMEQISNESLRSR